MFLHATYFYRHFTFIRLATKLTPLPMKFTTLRKNYLKSIIIYAVLVERKFERQNVFNS